jgi:tetratricopeptide (TPR) repeat protein
MRVKATNTYIPSGQSLAQRFARSQKIDEPEETPTHKPITKEEAILLEHKGLVSEGRVLYRNQEYQRAIEVFTQALEKQPNDLRVLLDRANCYIGLGRPENAMTDVDVVLGQDQNDYRALLVKAETYFSMGEFEYALVFFNRGNAIRRDIVAFRDGIRKCKSMIGC